MRRPRRPRLVHALALVVMVLAALVPSVLTLYRCSMEAEVTLAPCCEPRERAHDEAPTGPAIEAEHCCATVTVAHDRAPADLTARDALAGLAGPVAMAAPRAPRIDAPVPAPVAWTRAQFDAGPPLHVRVCALLI